GRHDARPKAVAGIGCYGQNLLLVAVERIGIEPKFLVPENVVEPCEQSGGFGPQFSGALGFTERIEHLRHAYPSIENITLKLVERLRPLHYRAVCIHDGIAGILPSHVLVAHRGTCLILLKSVTITIAIFVDPGETPFSRL